jgi:N-acetylglutamate synthase-like GNAT family acetyltransferase
VSALLSASGLPHGDVAPHLPAFLLAWQERTLVGTVGLELCGRDALLRSLCVRPELRGRGIASELCRRSTAFARDAGVERLYLLTTTAERFFAARGFTPVQRDGAPDAIRATVEFRSACPASAVCMARELPPE